MQPTTSTAGQDGASSVEAPVPSLARAAVRASAWVIGGNVASQAVRFASNIILARLLFPEVFGLSALVFILIQGLHMFSDVGTKPAIVQSERGDDPHFLNTGWTIAVVRGVLVWLAAWAIARPAAAFYGQPLLAVILPVAALNSVLDGFSSTSLATAQRHLQVKRLTLIELGSQVVATLANIVLVLAFRPLVAADRLNAIWALVGGSLVGTLLVTVLSHTALPGVRHRFEFEPAASRHLFRFGRWVFLSTMLTFLTSQADRLLLGKMIPLQLLGIYGIAATLAGTATQAIQMLGGRVLFPAYSKLAARGTLADAFSRSRLPLLLGGAALASGFVAAGPGLIRVLYDHRYAEAGWILQLLAVAAWFQVLDATNGAALLAQGRVDWMAASNATKLAALAAGLPIGLRLGGFRGALLAVIASDALKYAASATGARLGGLRCLRQDAGTTLASASVAAMGLLCSFTLGGWMRGRLSSFAAAAVPVALVWGAIGLVVYYRYRGGAGRRSGMGRAPSPAAQPSSR